MLTHAANSKTVLSDSVAEMLGRLANLFPTVQHAIGQMAQSSKVGLRVTALMALFHLSPCALHESIYKSSLQDRSKKVRMIAARGVDRLMPALLPELEQAVKREQDADTRDGLHYILTLLRDGYFVKTDDAGNKWVTCRFKDGGGSISHFFGKDLFETEGKAWIADKLSRF